MTATILLRLAAGALASITVVSAGAAGASVLTGPGRTATEQRPVATMTQHQSQVRAMTQAQVGASVMMPAATLGPAAASHDPATMHPTPIASSTQAPPPGATVSPTGAMRHGMSGMAAADTRHAGGHHAGDH